MDPVSTVAGVASAIKAVSEMVTGLRKKKADPDTERLLLEIETRLLALKKEALSLEKREISLLEENRDLRAKIRGHEEWTLEREKYEDKKVGENIVVVLRGQAGPPFFCHSCFQARSLHQLSKPTARREFDPRGEIVEVPLGYTHFCQACQTRFSLDEPSAESH